VTTGSEKKDLEQRVDYYKKEIAKLINEIEAIKSENQIIKLKLSNDTLRRNSENQSKTEISYYSRDNIMPVDSSRSKKRPKNTEESSLPKILRSSDENRNSHKKRESDTSLKMFGLGPSQGKADSK
jgi:hypothetical protein